MCTEEGNYVGQSIEQHEPWRHSSQAAWNAPRNEPLFHETVFAFYIWYVPHGPEKSQPTVNS